MSSVSTVFKECVRAILNEEFVERESRRDKEFHFQNWLRARLGKVGGNFEEPQRNVYPDFRLVRHAEGCELKKGS